MGKSPGKWIKTKLFGKKSSKSGFAKDVATGKSTSIISKAQLEELDLNPSVSTNTASQIPDRGGQNTEFEMDTTEDFPCDEVALLHRKQDADTRRTIGSKLPNDEIAREKEAATKTQAAFRGYLARRAFRALKGIMRLQALVRGHLVRRQAAATLGCMHAIVKFQALVRGRRIRLLDIGHEVVAKNSVGEPKDAEGVNFLRIDTKLSTTAFIRKLIASLPNAMPLSLQYDQAEPNSSWNWLERWSYARVWEPLARPRKVVGAKPQKIQSTMQIVDSEAAKPKRGSRKAPASNGDNNSLHSSELERSKRNLRKLLSHQAESVQEQPQNELERVKRNLRKISASAAAASEKSEVTIEKPEQSLRQVSNFPNPDIPEHKMDNASEKMSKAMVELCKPVDTEAPVKPSNEPVDINDHSVAESQLKNSEKVENSLLLNEESSLKEDQNSKENQRTRRRQSFPAKQEHSENVSQNSPTLPSYMAATESAKAKLRADGNSMVGDNGAKNDLLRRHSLPSSTNDKLNSSSPRMQTQLQANRKAGNKSNRLLSFSRDEKPTQPGWRR